VAEMFLWIDGIQGETLDKLRPGHIEIQSWSWETSNPVRWDQNQGGQSTKGTTTHFQVGKICDQGSVALYQYCVTGKHFKKAHIVCRKNDGPEKINYLTIEMEDVMIQHVGWAGQGDAQVLTENIQIQCAEFLLKYRTQRDSGNADGDVHFGFNVQTQVQK
jgi:type VI secretion system secreted protein Hcp